MTYRAYKMFQFLFETKCISENNIECYLTVAQDTIKIEYEMVKLCSAQ